MRDKFPLKRGRKSLFFVVKCKIRTEISVEMVLGSGGTVKISHKNPRKIGVKKVLSFVY